MARPLSTAFVLKARKAVAARREDLNAIFAIERQDSMDPELNQNLIKFGGTTPL